MSSPPTDTTALGMGLIDSLGFSQYLDVDHVYPHQRKSCPFEVGTLTNQAETVSHVVNPDVWLQDTPPLTDPKTSYGTFKKKWKTHACNLHTNSLREYPGSRAVWDIRAIKANTGRKRTPHFSKRGDVHIFSTLDSEHVAAYSCETDHTTGFNSDCCEFLFHLYSCFCIPSLPFSKEILG